MIVAEGINLQDFGIAHQRLEHFNPISQVASVINDGLIPPRGLLLNLFAVAQPADISEVPLSQLVR